ncbi:MAG: hypothetical protein ABSG03_18640 [Bryobacteraceae bacterium]
MRTKLLLAALPLAALPLAALSLAAALFAFAASPLFAFAASQWVYFGHDHKLHYRTDERGNRIMDFSCAGYRAGGVRLPDAPAVKTLAPLEGDNTPQIQAAIDEVSTRTPDANGLRGAVALKTGVYRVDGTVTIAASGVVLRGSGSGDSGTVIHLASEAHRFLEMRGTGVLRTVGNSAAITDAYVPCGANSFHVDDASAFHVGDAVVVERPVTEAWIHFMGMDTLVRDGKAQTWIKAGSSIHTDRTIQAISGKLITLDVPLTDSFDAKLLKAPGTAQEAAQGASMVRYEFPGRISQVGVENLRVAAPFTDVPITSPDFSVLRMDAVVDAWVKDVAVQETQNGIVIGPGAKRVTFERVRVVHSAAHSGAAAPADFSIAGTQILLDRCSVDGEGTWPVVTQASVTGPDVVLNFSGSAHAGVSPHQRWATGLLVDGARLPGTVARTPGIAFSNRKTAGSGHGWDIGWAVAWNVVSPHLLVQQPPGAMNWCIGCSGERTKAADIPEGIYDSPGRAVEPVSLYLEQLRERLGDAALVNIGY